MNSSPRVRVQPFETQEYTSHQYGDSRIDSYITEPVGGVDESTGLMLLIHGWGNDGSVSYESESIHFADAFNLVVVRVEYRDCGREAHHPEAPRTFDRPYDFSKMQTIDSLRAAHAALNHYPQLDHSRILLWGGSQGAHIAGQCLVFAPDLWSAAILCCGLYAPLTFERKTAGGFVWDCRNYPGYGFVEYALGEGQTFADEHEFDIRNTTRNAHLISATTPVAIIHGTVDDNVDIRHAVELYARLSAHGKSVSFHAIANGDHGLGGAEAPDENTRLKATLKHADACLHDRRATRGTWPVSTLIPVTDGHYEVFTTPAGPTLRFTSELPGASL
jgi:predicted esterase